MECSRLGSLLSREQRAVLRFVEASVLGLGERNFVKTAPPGYCIYLPRDLLYVLPRLEISELNLLDLKRLYRYM
jgi:hypothetical protein